MTRKKDSAKIVAALQDLGRTGPLASRSSDRVSKAERSGRAFHLGRAIAAVSDHDRAEARRAQVPIMGLIGPNGGGKTVAAVRQCLRELRLGGAVLSNLRLVDPATGEQPERFTLLTDYEQLKDAHDCLVLLDEVVATASSRSSSSLPFQVEYLLQTLRHSKVKLLWTAPAWKRADILIREVTQAVTECRGYYQDLSAIKGTDVSLWAPKRLFRLRTFDTVAFDEWTSGKRDKMRSDVKEWWWGPGSVAFDCYDTLGSVERVAESNESGRCLRCGGTRRAKACHCGPVGPVFVDEHEHEHEDVAA